MNFLTQVGCLVSEAVAPPTKEHMGGIALYETLPGHSKATDNDGLETMTGKTLRTLFH